MVADHGMDEKWGGLRGYYSGFEPEGLCNSVIPRHTPNLAAGRAAAGTVRAGECSSIYVKSQLVSNDLEDHIRR
jgi:hypothetical protein